MLHVLQIIVEVIALFCNNRADSLQSCALQMSRNGRHPTVDPKLKLVHFKWRPVTSIMIATFVDSVRFIS